MKRKKVLNKAVGYVFCGMLCLSIPMQVGAAEFAGSVSDSDIVQDTNMDADADTLWQTMVPDTTGMALQDAIQMLTELGEPIIEYVYSDDVESDVVMKQEEAEEDGQIHLTVSLGREPQEDLYTSRKEVDKLGSFGLSAYNAASPIVIDGSFDDWADIPCSYEYNWDNSRACWYDGVWEETAGLEGYKTPVGTYDDIVRHKVCLYADGEYAYLYVKFAKCYAAKFAGYDYRFYDSTGEYAQFNLTDLDGEPIILGSEKFQPGVHEICVKNGAGSDSPVPVDGAKAYLRINGDYMQSEIELKIPLSGMTDQNPRMSMEHMDVIQWDNPNLTYRRVTAAGAGTAPFVAAGIALAGVWGGMFFLGKKGRKQQKKEQ